MKKQILLAVAGLSLACAASSQAQIIFDDFNVDEGHFTSTPSSSPTSVGESTSSTADHTTDENPFEGAGHQKLTLIPDGGSTAMRIRHVSGGGSPGNNISFTTTDSDDGFIGYYIRTTTDGLETQLNLDSPENTGATMFGSPSVPIIADGQWHLYEFSLEASNWGPISGITGKAAGALVNNTYTIDSIYFRDVNGTPSPSGDFFLDFVAYNPDGSVAELVPVPEPTTYAMVFGLLALGGAIVYRRRTARA